MRSSPSPTPRKPLTNFDKLKDGYLGTPLSFKDYYDRGSADDRKKMDANLNAKEVRKLRNPPGPYRMDEFVISPKDIDISDKLEDVTDETPD